MYLVQTHICRYKREPVRAAWGLFCGLLFSSCRYITGNVRIPRLLKRLRQAPFQLVRLYMPPKVGQKLKSLKSLEQPWPYSFDPFWSAWNEPHFDNFKNWSSQLFNQSNFWLRSKRSPRFNLIANCSYLNFRIRARGTTVHASPPDLNLETSKVFR